MAKISDLVVYPVKSCKGVHLKSAVLTEAGIKFDRQWMVVDETGEFVTQREQPRLAFVTPSIVAAGLQLDAPGMDPLTLPIEPAGSAMTVGLFGETFSAFVADHAADDWFSEYLGGRFRLAAFDPAVHRPGGVQYPERDPAPTRFPDNYGILVISDASLADLNNRLETPLPMNRFRPNVVISGVSEYEEDYLESITVDDVRLRFVDLCYRCNFTTIDQDTATFGAEPLQTLGTYRYDEKAKNVKFGAYAAVDRGAGLSLHLNDEVALEWKF